VGWGTVDFDSSTLYVEANGAASRIEDNRFISRNDGDAGSLGLRTAIEVHGDNVTVERNTVSGFNTGVNIGGGWPSTAVVVRNNHLLNVISGVVLFTDTGRSDPAANVGLQTIVIDDNVMTLNVNGWQATPLGKDSVYAGVRIEQEGTQDREMIDISITANDIRFVNAGGPGHPTSDHFGNGIHFNRAWSSSATNVTDTLRITNNQITDSPGSGVLINAPIRHGVVSGNVVANPGIGTASNSWIGWQSGINLQNRLESFRVVGNRFLGSNLRVGVLAGNDVVGDNTQGGNAVVDSAVPVFVRDGGQGVWTAQ
jgi:hypothetical protein